MIQNYMIEIFFLLSLIVLSWIDIKHREFPAILTTGILFVVAMVKINNLEFGILAFIFALFLMEMDIIRGVADLKIITVLGFFANELGIFFILVILILIFTVAYNYLMVKVMKFKDKIDEVPFIPVFLFVFITLLAIQII